MKRLLAVGLLAGASLIGFLSQACESAPVVESNRGLTATDPSVPIFFCGYVLEEGSEAPVAGALVQGECGWCEWVDFDKTDANGYFVITGGDHAGHHGDIGASAKGYIPMVVMINPLGPSPNYAVIHLTKVKGNR